MQSSECTPNNLCSKGKIFSLALLLKTYLALKEGNKVPSRAASTQSQHLQIFVSHVHVHLPHKENPLVILKRLLILPKINIKNVCMCTMQRKETYLVAIILLQNEMTMPSPSKSYCNKVLLLNLWQDNEDIQLYEPCVGIPAMTGTQHVFLLELSWWWCLDFNSYNWLLKQIKCGLRKFMKQSMDLLWHKYRKSGTKLFGIWYLCCHQSCLQKFLYPDLHPCLCHLHHLHHAQCLSLALHHHLPLYPFPFHAPHQVAFYLNKSPVTKSVIQIIAYKSK